ncbi:MAG TPA: protease HtpX [Oligoflexia bacterium]|nr:protease HtpX [Oligoflexia bacterium]HMP48953.1 protease HtpX [Oligoflexia bacterium]
MKRVFLFLLTNILIIATISIITSLLGVRGYLNESGIDYQALLVFCLIWGFTGSFISLLLSRFMAKKMMGVVLIDPRNPGQNSWLVETTFDICRRANLPKMPEVGIYNSPDVNAFATGPSQSRALVAVSSGLLQKMSKDEIEGVLAHEVAHIKNGDMVTLTLIQGVVNAFVMFLSRAAAFALGQAVKDDMRYMVRMVATIVFDILFGIMAIPVVAWFSRQREFRADAGSASYVGSNKMKAALQALLKMQNSVATREEPEAIQAFKISSRRPTGWKAYFSTHPPLEERIRALN